MPTALTSPPHFRASAAGRTRICVLASVLTCAAPASAQQPPGPDEPEGSSWGLGLAVFNAQNGYKQVDRETRALPMVSFENRYVKLSGPDLELKLPGLTVSDSQRLSFGLVVSLLGGGGGYEPGDSPALTGMAERKSGAWAGAKMEWENDLADVQLEVLGDASGDSKGQRIVLGLGRKWMLSPSLILVPQVGFEWVDKNYVDFYYGVRANEVAAGRAAYVGEATVNPEISLTSLYRIDEHQALMLNAGIKFLGKEIKNSPIVDRSSENKVMLAYVYKVE